MIHKYNNTCEIFRYPRRMSILTAKTVAASASPPNQQVRLYGCTMRFWNSGCKQQCNWYKNTHVYARFDIFVRFFSRFCKTLGDDLSDPPRSGAVLSLLRTIYSIITHLCMYTHDTRT